MITAIFIESHRKSTAWLSIGHWCSFEVCRALLLRILNSRRVNKILKHAPFSDSIRFDSNTCTRWMCMRNANSISAQCELAHSPRNMPRTDRFYNPPSSDYAEIRKKNTSNEHYGHGYGEWKKKLKHTNHLDFSLVSTRTNLSIPMMKSIDVFPSAHVISRTSIFICWFSRYFIFLNAFFQLRGIS